MGMGVSIKIAEEPKPPIIGILDWLKANWPWVASGGIGLGLIIALAKPKRRK